MHELLQYMNPHSGIPSGGGGGGGGLSVMRRVGGGGVKGGYKM